MHHRTFWLCLLLAVQTIQTSTDPGLLHIAHLPECQEDIDRYCHDVHKANDIAIIECMQDMSENEATSLSYVCELLVWEFKVNLTQGERFKVAANKFCADEMHEIPEMGACAYAREPFILSCMLDFKSNVTTEKCHKFLLRTQRLAFSDFRLVGTFVEHCGQFVKVFECGSMEPPIEGEHHSQGQAMECLIEKSVENHVLLSRMYPGHFPVLVNKQCLHEIMRISELQAEDYHLDRPLYFACRSDRDIFCPKVLAEDGQVLQCLMMHKEDGRITEKCRKILVERSQLMAVNHKFSYPLIGACGQDIEQNCDPMDYMTPERDNLNYVLLCLRNSTHTTQELGPKCTEQLVKHRQLMLSDFRMSPELVISCDKDIKENCRGQLVDGGRTLQCLMQVARSRNLILSSGCSFHLGQLVKAADPVSSYRVDRVLDSSCQQLIQGKCNKEAMNEQNGLSCLMRHLEDDEMTDECEDRLLQIQYFIARDWTMDARLFRACRDDAKEKCNAYDGWHTVQAHDTKHDLLVLLCLNRLAYSEKPEDKLTKRCTFEVRRVLRERTSRIYLLPHVGDACLMALSVFCPPESTQPSEELICLQHHMETIREERGNYGECWAKLAEFSEMEAKDFELNSLLSKSCRPVINKYCKHLTDQDIDYGQVTQCLMQNKRRLEMTDKCLAYIKHSELLSMRDYHYSYPFKKACSEDIRKYCSEVGNYKTTIVDCLNEVVFRYQVLLEGEPLESSCVKELSLQYLIIDKEDASDHHQLNKLCGNDIVKSNCRRSDDTVGDVIECLRQQGHELIDPRCESLLFRRQKIEFVNAQLDSGLMKTCRVEINELCSKVDDVLACLKHNHKSKEMAERCRSLTEKRAREQARDIRLQPNLFKACKPDLQKHCVKEYQSMWEPQYAENIIDGAAVNCLRRITGARMMYHNKKCENEMHRVIVESEVDPQLDVVFYRACKPDIQNHCGRELTEGWSSHGDLPECIEAVYYEHKLNEKICRWEMARRVGETLFDIRLDPYLSEACAVDLKHYCNDVPPGEGRLISCLISACQSASTPISKNCLSRLEDRKKLWNRANICRKILVERSQLMAVDYKISHPLVEACQQHVEQNCARDPPTPEPENKQLDYALRCLQNTARTTQELGPKCTEQLLKHRQLMMSDFRMSPELVVSCAKEIEENCFGQLVGGGSTLKCLMHLHVTSTSNPVLSSGCSFHLRQLLKVADPGSSYGVDRVLESSCQQLLQGKCSKEAMNEQKGLSCLMRHMDDDEMADECKTRLLQIEYFVARDWTMDATLYNACRVDAREKCNAYHSIWHKMKEVEIKNNSLAVLLCLYRKAYSENPEDRVSKRCTFEVRRLLRERTARVNLLPHVGDVCLNALSVFCAPHAVEPGEELKCLQENMDTIQEEKDKYYECGAKLAEFTEMEAKDFKLNRLLNKSCRPVINKYCMHLTDQDVDYGQVMQCLVRNKGRPEMTDKCSASIGHFERVSMRDYNFCYSFKKACSNDISKHCSEIGNSTTIVVVCLSEVMFRNQIFGEAETLQGSCAKQLTIQYLNINNVANYYRILLAFHSLQADTDAHAQLKRSCGSDIQKSKCHKLGDTVSDVTECLRRQEREKLSPRCEALLFNRQKMEFANPKLDSSLMKTCHNEIDELCSKANNVLDCLKRNRKIQRERENQHLGEKCLSMIEQRAREQAQDLRLQPNLFIACKQDLQEHCVKEYDMMRMHGYEQHMVEGSAVNCLRRIVAGRDIRTYLNKKCENEVHRVIVESEVDPQLDIHFYRACKLYIQKHCDIGSYRAPPCCTAALSAPLCRLYTGTALVLYALFYCLYDLFLSVRSAVLSLQLFHPAFPSFPEDPKICLLKHRFRQFKRKKKLS